MNNDTKDQDLNNENSQVQVLSLEQEAIMRDAAYELSNIIAELGAAAYNHLKESAYNKAYIKEHYRTVKVATETIRKAVFLLVNDIRLPFFGTADNGVFNGSYLFVGDFKNSIYFACGRGYYSKSEYLKNRINELAARANVNFLNSTLFMDLVPLVTEVLRTNKPLKTSNRG